MKSLLEIQQNIRDLEKGVREITDNIQSIHSDIEEIRNASGASDIVDFSRIEILAKLVPFRRHPIHKEKDGRNCQIYLEMLLHIVRLDSDPEKVVNRMVFIQWLWTQAEIDWSLEKIYRQCLTLNEEAYAGMMGDIPESYQDYLVVDALMTAGIAGKANQDIYGYIADMAAVFGIHADRLKELALVARTALCQTIGRDLKHEELMLLWENMKKFSHYIDHNLAETVIRAVRHIEVALQDAEVRNFKWWVKQEQQVKAGDIIATYSENASRQSGAKLLAIQKIKTKYSGTIFQFRDNNTNYGVVSHGADTKEAIKAWVKLVR